MNDERPRVPKFKCPSGLSQAAITPAGELKICLMIDNPKYNILDVSIKKAWQMSRQHS